MSGVAAAKADGSHTYIFSEAELEEHEFHAAAFVAKYRRVTPLESLRDQFRQCVQGLKDQLYDTINKDYKDFISIATKLEGVDTRVDHLRKPLVDLRMEALSLHDSLVTSLENMENKIRKKLELRQRALLLETSLSCISKFEGIELVLSSQEKKHGSMSKHSPSDETPIISKRSELMRFAMNRESRQIANYRKSSAVDSADTTALLHLLRTHLIKVSELERAAYDLAASKKSLTQLAKQLEVTSGDHAQRNSVGISDSSNKNNASTLVYLTERASHLEANLVSCTHEMLSQSLVSITEPQFPESLTADAKALLLKSYTDLKCRILTHVLRTLYILKREDVASAILAETIVYPLARSVLSQSRVDGGGTRGYYAGLEDALLQIGAAINGNATVKSLLLLAENVFSTTAQSQTDLLIDGVWKPIASVLVERYSGMFSVGIATAFHAAFSAVEAFILYLPNIIIPREKLHSDAEYACYLRVNRNNEILSFRSKWKFDIYFQLRRQEVISRFEHVMNATTTAGTDGNKSITSRSDALGTLNSVYFTLQKSAPTVVPVPTNSSGSSAVIASVQVQSTSQTIPATDARDSLNDVVSLLSKALKAQNPIQIKIPFLQGLVVEVATCLHSKVFMPPLVAPFVALIIQLFVRVEAQICSALPNINPPSFPNKEIMIKGLQSSLVVSSLSAGNPAFTSLDDIMLLLNDLGLLIVWLREILPSQIYSRVSQEGNENFFYNSDSSLIMKNSIYKSLEKQSFKIHTIMSGCWFKIQTIIISDCKGTLQAVKAVASKYRLTNKPPPDAASPYVISILQPLKDFNSKYEAESVVQALNIGGNSSESHIETVLQQWRCEIIEDVTASYLQQVQTLVETARQMDSVFMKRSKTSQVQSTVKNAASSLTDSEKIALQIILDIKSFEKEILVAGVPDPLHVTSFAALFSQIGEMKKVFENLQNLA